MLVLMGLVTVIASILLGFTVAGGHVLVLFQWSEFLIVVGTALGSIFIAVPPALLKKIYRTVFDLFCSQHDRQSYLQLLKMIYDLLMVGQRQGLRELEQHVEDPHNSDILSRNRRFIRDEVSRGFLCDAIKILVMQALTPHELETMIDADIETFENESKPIGTTLTKVADSLPGIGIVAAVLGIIVTMSSIDQGAEYVGHHVAAALVGTFIGVLLCYGFVSPIATNIEHLLDSKVRHLEAIKGCIVAYARGHSPTLAVEMARRAIPSERRPGFLELERFLHERDSEE
jgi:chemotaxis protein MotA